VRVEQIGISGEESNLEKEERRGRRGGSRRDIKRNKEHSTRKEQGRETTGLKRKRKIFLLIHKRNHKMPN
jgi:hypothetical protein